MANYTATFERVEKKYLLTAPQLAALSKKLMGRMDYDRYGEHSIGNIYYDTVDFDLIRASLDKPTYKEKLRVRSYGVPKNDDAVFVELKKKFDGVVYKRRVSMPLNAATRFLRGGAAPEGTDAQMQNELRYAMNLYGAVPRALVAYDRVAMAGREDATFRLTLDRAIRYRTDDLDLTHGFSGAPLLQRGETLMEVKTTGALPLWFARILSELAVYPTSYSKYGAAYRDMQSGSIGGMRVA